MGVLLGNLYQNELELTEAQKEQLYDLLSGYLRQPNKAKLTRLLDLPLSIWASRLHNWQLDRIEFKDDRACYFAGQDYPHELSQIKKQLLR